jgi:hypothetical protein
MPFPTPDPAWIPFLKVLFGYLLVLTLAVLACIIALGKVEAASSFGLDIILGGLMVLSGGFANWCFKVSKDEEPK